MGDESGTFSGTPSSLAKMLDFGAGQEPLWTNGELGAILRHQMDALLEPDLGKVHPAIRDQKRALTTGNGKPIGTFGDLFRTPHPPLELLEATKRFAKYSRTHEESLPAEIATALYYLAIAAALTKCGRRITALDDQALQHGLDWVRQHMWLDENSRTVLDEARRLLGRHAP